MTIFKKLKQNEKKKKKEVTSVAFQLACHSGLLPACLSFCALGITSYHLESMVLLLSEELESHSRQNVAMLHSLIQQMCLIFTLLMRK